VKKKKRKKRKVQQEWITINLTGGLIALNATVLPCPKIMVFQIKTGNTNLKH
jgi:hypothetical protein